MSNQQERIPHLNASVPCRRRLKNGNALFIAYCLLLCCVLGCGNCKTSLTPADVLPPYTETGANTFGCLVDGKLFLPKKKFLSSFTKLQCNYNLMDNKYSFVLSAANEYDYTGVSIYCPDFILKNDTVFHYSYIRGKISWLSSKFQTLDTSAGDFYVKHFDPINGIISGTFWFNAVDTSTNKVVHITDGRFDVHLGL
jgi:hypothetical protein